MESTLHTVNTPHLCDLVSDGLAAHQYLANFTAKVRSVSNFARAIMLGEGKDPYPTAKRGSSYKLGVIFWDECAGGGKCHTRDVWAEMSRRGLLKPHPEVAAILRDRYTQEEVLAAVNALRRPDAPRKAGSVVVMHEPIRYARGDVPYVLALTYGGKGVYRGEEVDHLTAFIANDDQRHDVSYQILPAFIVLMPE